MSSASPQSPILHIEDDEDAIFLTRRVFEKAGIAHAFDVVRDGKAAVDYLEERLREGGAPLPPLILIDLDLPRKDGFAVLEWISRQPALNDVMAVVLSSSLEPESVNRAFALGAAGYLAKYPSPAEVSALYAAAVSPDKWRKVAAPA